MSARKRNRNGDVIGEESRYAKSSKSHGSKKVSVPRKQVQLALSKPAPFSHDEEAIAENENCDYSIKISLEMAKSGKAPRPVRVYADGIYDMFHSGHARQLMQVKMAVPNAYLIVGVCDDELTHKMKGRTVMNESERYEAVRHCRYVDELLTGAPWTVTDEFLEKQKIDFVAHDDLPYGAGGTEDIYKGLKEKGMFLATQRTEGISTTDVIARIIKDYDMYVRRNLSRGYSAKDLNVSYMKEKKIQFETNFNSIKDKGKELIDKTKDKGHELLHRWEERSKDFIGNFLEMFGRDGRLSTWIRAISPPSSPTPDMSQGDFEEEEEDMEDSFETPKSFSPTASPPPKRGRKSPTEDLDEGTS
ncbi:choline-phosphate cytidylyltransferase B-like isoform X2 [Saccostrea echinata]|uniref:choline-phosphate cytidylyltransferase B-like isoform X2 n=1 Tax=Saccostrea echinata TaxID=191078 RepID=UPI002A8381E2|nr:choline-phosphate cytidylyltransferase B-like isoform X2 [Saccostrea echinata]